MKNAHVIGLGKSGVAAARLLHREGWQVVLSDRGISPALVTQQEALRQDGITVLLDYSFVPDSRTNLLVVSPGVPWDSSALVAARENGLEVIGETELAWRFLQDRPWVGITGTNGKTTTTALTAAIFQAAGLNAPACGNIGYAACELALEPTVPDWVIAELSSYQIEASATLAPQIGLWTTLTPDHLQRHGTVANYAQIKATLMHRSELAVFNGDDPYLRQHLPEAFPAAYWTSAGGKRAIAPLRPSAYIDDGWVKFEGIPIVRADALRMVGDHNQQNLLLAVTAACLAELDTEAIAAGVTAFPGVPHRLEHICTWQGIDFINDSKATNYDAAEVGLRSVAAPAVLIAGGEAKEGDDTAWVQRIHERAATVLLIGDAAPQFAQRLEASGYANYTIVETLERAVERSAEVAPALGAAVVLLSPACASFDQYPNFEQRGEHFRQLCQERFS
ncbi:UDP-N-acetylmuramoyl-L-alanine--D-glutamate ligase [Nodosilinea sp. PGN35]|uniref:UDP-N-acetylmuramoyl-L-alanine--D-glutamate ligase n=1 Tax=Nodosilinea sp. PGN35 TaxID=3020489 RepID=UPI0023B26185|nr:UDP-N-acetylmuramoyl-L-alanine--D-glutamate ligase [Nodosilinea sp. TSF1-S3]MDF0366415.1 UDP-N-acetylmuramoyl-L-alanine--D-glutamate ligase [Nodosilinea sp. TSF1-S3]